MVGKVGKVILFLLDIVFINLTFIVALALRFEGNIQVQYKILYREKIYIITLVLLGAFFIFNLYSSLWRYASIRELLQVIGACLVGNVVLVGIGNLTGERFPMSVHVMYPLLLIAMTVCIRFGYRFLRKMVRSSINFVPDKFVPLPSNRTRVMLVGAGAAASIIVKDTRTNWQTTREIILAVDDNQNKHHARLNGVKVHGDTKSIPELAEAYQIDEIIIAIPSATKKRIAEVVSICNETKCKLKIFPGINEAFNPANNGKRKNYIRDIKVEDLLGRDEIILDNKKLQGVIENKTVLVTGGGGSIGSELCRQIVNLNPMRILIFDIYENNAYDLQMELLQSGVSEEKLVMLIGSVRDKVKLQQVFEKYRPDIVFHAAAHKHVPLMEANPSEAIKNNVFGTFNVAQCAMHYETSKFVLVSTDKAVNPTNVMGATKRMCEMIVQAINTVAPHTDFVAVRFGNVLGSNGSVIPLFKRQLEGGGPLTVTHPDIIRYFMTIPEAVRLILEATTFATGGEIFVLDMGEPVKIHDLARNFVKLSGFEPEKDIQIKFTGLRPGEKLYEELLMDEEGLSKTESDKIFIGKPGSISYGELIENLQVLQNALEREGNIREALMSVVPTYRIPNYNKQIV